MRRFVAIFAILLAACGSGPEPVSTGPMLRAEPAARFRDSAAPGREAAFSPDGRWLANGGRARGGLGTLWHGLTGAGGAGEAVRLWRVADGALVQILEGPEDVMHVGFSPDGRWLVTSADNGAVTLWRLRLGRGRALALD
jgi:hypothetical protein